MIKQSEGKETASSAAVLNDAQRLHLRVGCEYIDKLLGEIEAILHSAESASPFPRYVLDISPAQSRVIEDFVRRLRSQLLRVLAWQHIESPPPSIPATRAIATHLHFVDIAIADMRPRAMRGAGSLSPTAEIELTGIVRELSSVSDQMMSYVSFELQESLDQRVQSLARAGKGSLLLQRVEQVITSRGLVEFRPRLDLLLTRLEESTFEVAVFGRVSAGKSSFLNTLLGTDILPVGVNPITAVPTRLRYGPEVRAKVRFGTGPLAEVSLEQLRSLISEEGNPGNRQGVRQAIVEVPSGRLSEGIVLVDTPGLGSLALKGAKETLAYLPSCDLGLVLIDAGATLSPEDTGTLRLLQGAGIPALVLLSKADLLSDEQRRSAIEYIGRQIDVELRTTVAVHPISSLLSDASMVERFYEEELWPRFQRSQELRTESVNTKLVRLQRDLLSALETRIRRMAAAQSMDSSSVREFESQLLNAASRLGNLERTVEDQVLKIRAGHEQVLEEKAASLAHSMSMGAVPTISLTEVSHDLEGQVQDQVGTILASMSREVALAIEEIRRVGRELNSTGLPDKDEILGLLRDAPRVELPVAVGFLEPGGWKLLGEKVLRSHIKSKLNEILKPSFRDALESYGATLDLWTRQRLREMRLALDSFANIYRAQLQDAVQSNSAGGDAELLRSDVELLSNL